MLDFDEFVSLIQESGSDSKRRQDGEEGGSFPFSLVVASHRITGYDHATPVECSGRLAMRCPRHLLVRTPCPYAA